MGGEGGGGRGGARRSGAEGARGVGVPACARAPRAPRRGATPEQRTRANDDGCGGARAPAAGLAAGAAAAARRVPQAAGSRGGRGSARARAPIRTPPRAAARRQRRAQRAADQACSSARPEGASLGGRGAAHAPCCGAACRQRLHYVILPNAVPPRRFEAHLEVHAGSIDEEVDEQGLAHLVEHVTFLGSKKREGLLGTGSRSNAYTDFHHTVFHIHSPLEGPLGQPMVRLALEALEEIAFQPRSCRSASRRSAAPCSPSCR